MKSKLPHMLRSATLLFSSLNAPTAAADIPFSDVLSSSWYW